MSPPTLEDDVTAFVEIQAAEVKLQRLMTMAPNGPSGPHSRIAEDVALLITTALQALADAKASINRRRVK